MHSYRSALMILFAAVLLSPAMAEDQIIDVKPCNFLCRAWRNMSHNANVSASNPVDQGYVPTEPLPEAADGATLPSLSSLTATPGSIMVESPAERREAERHRARMKILTSSELSGDGQVKSPRGTRPPPQ